MKFSNVKKALTIVIAFLLLITAIPVSAQKSVLPEAPELSITEYDTDSSYSSGSDTFNLNILPESYSAVDQGVITEPKDQKNHGTCWTFAAASMAETSLLATNSTYSGGKTATVENTDLSEAQIAYFTYRNTYDPLGNLDGDGTAFLGENWLECGGNHFFTTLSFAAWKGLCEDADMPYEELTQDSQYDLQLSYKAAARLENAMWLNMSDTKSIKELIMLYGSVLSDYAHYDEFLNEENGSYYCPEEYSTNHAITVVGWDDNYSKNNFKNAPERDGAWLVKNSWGTDWCNNGYGWISYCDTTLSNSDAACMIFTDAAKYDNNYQYDGSCVLSSISLPENMMVANTYTVSAASKERLKAVSFALMSTNVEYSIQIYKDCKSSEYMDGEPLLSEEVEGQTTYAGYYTIELPEDIILSRGDEYTVCITFESKTDDYIDVLIDRSSVDSNGMFGFTNNTEYDKSYYGQNYKGSPSGMYFFDLVESYDCTARIKAFTNSLDENGEGIVPETTVPEITESETTEPEATEPETTEPETTKSETTEPETTKTEFTLTMGDNEYVFEEGCTVELSAPFYVDKFNYGHRFKYWICSEDDLIDDINKTDISFEMPAKNIELTPKYNMVGDIDDDGVVAGIDLLQLNSIIRGNSEDPFRFGDIDNDGVIAGTDLLYVFKIIQGSYIPEE